MSDDKKVEEMFPTVDKNGKATHPKSLKNLIDPKLGGYRFDNPETAKKAQEASVAKRRQNKLMREALKQTMTEYKEFKDVVDSSEMSALNILKIEMYKAIEESDTDRVLSLIHI